MRVLIAAAALLALAAGCGHQDRRQPTRPVPAQVKGGKSWGPRARRRATQSPEPLQALVTAQTENRLLVVDLPSGRVVKQVIVPGDPEYVATSPTAACSIAVVVSAASGTVTLLDSPSLRPIKVFRGFVSPHIPAIFPDTEHAYVTDDASGKLTVIGLYDHRILARVPVGVGAHHLAFSPDWRQVWVALGQSARTITLLSTLVSTPPPPSSPVGNPARPHVVGHFDPGFLVHDLRFTADNQRVWITSASTAFVGVFSARTHRLLFRVPGGPPPQHVVFEGGFAYITSGYGSRIEKARLSDGQVVARAHAPYGSFDLDAAGGYIVTSSLLRGTLAIFNRQLRLLHVRRLAPSTEDVSICRR